MFRKLSLAVACGVYCAVAAAPAVAGQYKFTANGVITYAEAQIYALPSFHNVQVGNAWSFETVYDTAVAVDLDPNPHNGRYGSGVLYSTVTIGSNSLTVDGVSQPVGIFVDDDAEDLFAFFPWMEYSNILILLTDPSGTAFQSDALPTSLGSFSSRLFQDDTGTVMGTVDSYSLTLVPEPASALLLLSGAMLIRRSRRQRALR